MKTFTLTNTYGKNTAIDSMCISIAFFRPTGSNPFQVNGIPIEEGTQLTINQNVGDLDVSKYIITFQAGVGANEAYVIKVVPEDTDAYLRN